MPSAASLSRFGVASSMMPWLYDPRLNQPMSSPIMTRIFGFFSCACSGPAAPMSATVAVRTDQPYLITFDLYFINFSGLLEPEDASFVREGCLSTKEITLALSPRITQQEFGWDKPGSGGVPPCALRP